MTARPGAAALASGATLEAGRLRLRMFHEGDLDGLAALYGDAETMRHIGDGRVLSREETWRAIAGMLGHWALRGYGMWALERCDDGRLIGRVGYLHPEGWPGLEIGWLLERSAWGQGYAREAAVAALAWGRHERGLRQLISLIRAGNLPSERLALHLGARLDGEVQMMGSPANLFRYPA